MCHSPEPRFLRRVAHRAATATAPSGVAFVLLGCGAAARRASAPHGTTPTTAASSAAPRVDRLVVAGRGNLSVVARGGCVATVHSSEGAGDDELHVRCP